jgi:hypothetical protein
MNRKILIGMVTGLSLATLGIATWVLLGFNGSATAYVISTQNGEQPIQFTSTLGTETLDTSNSSDEYSSYVDVLDKDGMVNLTIDKSVLKYDNTTDDCTDYADDCTVTVNDGSRIINSGETLRFWVNYSCVRLSCPQRVVTLLNITANPA